MRFALACIVSIVALAGCQTTDQYEAQKAAALSGVLTNYTGRPVSAFMQNNPQFSLVSAYNVDGGRVFVFEDDPVVITTTSMPSVPAPRQYGDPTVDAAFNNLNAALFSTPAVSRSSVQVCRISIEAARTGTADAPSSWTIKSASGQGRTC